MNLELLNPKKYFEQKIKDFLNEVVSDYGQVSNFSLLWKSRKIQTEFLLTGEKESIRIEAGDFRIKKVGDDNYLKIGNLESSREWLTSLGNDYLQGKFGPADIKLSSKIAAILKTLKLAREV